jgi:hypothetical protein
MVDGDGKLLTDRMRLAFNEEGEVLVVGWDEVKLESVGADALQQIDDDILRMQTRGITLADGSVFPPDRIQFPRRAGTSATTPALSAYIESATAGPLLTPAGLPVTRVGVQADYLQEFARKVLVEYRKALP